MTKPNLEDVKVIDDEVEDPGREAWRLLFQLFRSQRRVMQATHADFDLNPGQLHLLMNIEPDRAVPMSELAEALACDASYITGLVDRLEARGIVQRTPAPGDRRVKLVGLTEPGRLLHEQLKRRFAQPPPFIEALSAADKRTLRDIFSRAMQQSQDAPQPTGK